jgi:hypothetical protein
MRARYGGDASRAAGRTVVYIDTAHVAGAIAGEHASGRVRVEVGTVHLDSGTGLQGHTKALLAALTTLTREVEALRTDIGARCGRVKGSREASLPVAPNGEEAQR